MIQTIESIPFSRAGVQLHIKRDDHFYPVESEAGRLLCGNKWRKLKHNLTEARLKGYDTLLTFGGAFSNHIAATATAGVLFGFKTIGIIRGDEVSPLNHTLRVAQSHGMNLRFVSRARYRQKSRPDFLQSLRVDYGDFYLIPEGGSNCLAMAGLAEMTDEIAEQIFPLPDWICVAAGTGGTAAGIIAALAGRSNVLVIPVLKGGFMRQEIEAYLFRCMGRRFNNWQIADEYHFGGYGKYDRNLIDFINAFYDTYQIPLDPVYTGKMMYGVFDLLNKSFFAPGTQVLAIHTGGLQGNIGFQEKNGKILTFDY